MCRQHDTSQGHIWSAVTPLQGIKENKQTNSFCGPALPRQPFLGGQVVCISPRGSSPPDIPSAFLIRGSGRRDGGSRSSLYFRDLCLFGVGFFVGGGLVLCLFVGGFLGFFPIGRCQDNHDSPPPSPQIIVPQSVSKHNSLGAKRHRYFLSATLPQPIFGTETD